MSDNLFKIVCPGCGSKLNAKPSLIGQTRPCPRCKAMIEIQDPSQETIPLEPDPVAPEANQTPFFSAAASPDDLEFEGHVIDQAHVEKPTKLASLNKYLVLGRDCMIAKWEGPDGWQVQSAGRFVAARRSEEELPNRGNFILVELHVAADGNFQHRLSGMKLFALQEQWALVTLGRGENEILGKITGPGMIAIPQKQLVLKYLRTSFMPEFVDQARNVLEFLTNTDQHSNSAGD